MIGGELYDRVVEVRAGVPGSAGLSWSELSIEFAVEHSSGRTPNKCEVTIYNLSDFSVGFLEQTPGLTLQLLAGYKTIGPSLLFSGWVRPRDVRTAWTGADRLTTISSEDSGPNLAWQDADFSEGYQGRVSRSKILLDIAASMGLGVRYIDPKVTDPVWLGPAFVGSARRALDQVLDGSGARWTIQNGQLVVLKGENTLPDEAVLLSAETGLVGDPERTDKGLNIVSLLQPSIVPGSIVSIASKAASGFYKAVKVSHAGAIRGNEFYTTIEAKPIGD